MSMKKSFVDSLPIVAKAIGRRYGVKVVFGGSQACTDGNTIYLPDLPPEKDGLPVLLNGYLDHEAAHCRFTDFDVERAKGVPFQLWLENALEDIRIETQMGQCYPGCKVNLAALTARLVDDGETEAVTQESPPVEVLSSYILHGLRYRVLGQDALKPVVAQANKSMVQVFPQSLIDRLDPALAEIRQARSTQDVVDLAARIMDMLRDEAPEQNQPEDSDQSDESGESCESGEAGEQGNESNSGSEQFDAADDSGAAGDQAEDNPEDSGDSEGKVAHGDDESDDEAEQSGESEDDSSQSGGSDEGEGSIQKVLEADASELPEDRADTVSRMIEDEANEPGADQPPVRMAEAGGEGFAKNTLLEPVDEQAARQASARLRSRLAGLLQAQRLEYDLPARSGRRVNRHALPKLRMGNPRIFRQQIESAAVNTAVTVLLDRSGSMAGSRLTIAREAALSLTFALEETDGVNASTFAFPGYLGRHNEVEVLHRRNQRVDAKAFGIAADGGTPLVEAAWFAGWDLLQADEPRKILLVITDGQPHDPSGSQDVLKRLRADGIETLAIGIRTAIPDALFPEHVVINDVSQLSGQLFSMMEKKLVTAA